MVVVVGAIVIVIGGLVVMPVVVPGFGVAVGVNMRNPERRNTRPAIASTIRMNAVVE